MKNQFICQADLAQNRVLRCIIYVLPAAPVFQLSGSILWHLIHEFHQSVRANPSLDPKAYFTFLQVSQAPSWAHCVPSVLHHPHRTDQGRRAANHIVFSFEWKNSQLKPQHSGWFDNLFVPLFFRRLQSYKYVFSGKDLTAKNKQLMLYY